MKKHYRAVFENAGVGINVLDRDGKIVQVNQALLRMLGYNEMDLYERTFAEIPIPMM